MYIGLRVKFRLFLSVLQNCNLLDR